MITLQDIREMAMALPGAEEGLSYGTPAFRVGKRLFLRMHGEEDAVVIMLDNAEQQQELIEGDPSYFYITDHYRGQPAVLVSTMICRKEFQRVVEMAWRRVARKKDLEDFAG